MKRFAPAAGRNLAPIRDALEDLLAGVEGHLLEIGSGTGQHAVGLAPALPGLNWWPSDPDPDQRASIEAWRLEAGVANLRPPLALDAAASWALPEDSGGAGPPAGDLAAVFCANVIHIAPWAVAEGLFAGAGRHLAAAGRLLLYGPFSRGGRHHAESNAVFDADLRSRDPAWGVRDLDDLERLAGTAGLLLEERRALPANNDLLVFARRRAAPGG